MSTCSEREDFWALVVDDDPVVRRMVSFALQQEGFLCDSANDGEHALSLLSKREYDLLVVDLRMPNKHGHALAVDVLAGDSRPKIIVHTAVDDPRVTKDLIIRGVDDVIYKPTNYAAFAAKAMGLVVRNRKVKQGERPVELMTEDARRSVLEKQDRSAMDRYASKRVSEMETKPSNRCKARRVWPAARGVSNTGRFDSYVSDDFPAGVRRDPVLAWRVLQLANNPHFNSTGYEITDIEDAIRRIGQNRIVQFVLAMKVLASAVPHLLLWIDVNFGWQRSAAVAIAVEQLVTERINVDVSEGMLPSAMLPPVWRPLRRLGDLEQNEVTASECTNGDVMKWESDEWVFAGHNVEVICELLADLNIIC